MSFCSRRKISLLLLFLSNNNKRENPSAYSLRVARKVKLTRI